MKTIPNPIYRFVLDGKPATAASFLGWTLLQPPQQGFDFATMRARGRIADVLEKLQPGEEIKLEDADYAVARGCVETMRWPMSHPDICKFGELFGL